MKDEYCQPLKSGLTYHIFNRGNNGENIFPEARNYSYFLKKYREYIAPIADTYAWCLMPNHFHVMLHFKDYWELYRAYPKRFPAPPRGVLTGNDLSTKAHAELARLSAWEFQGCLLISLEDIHWQSTKP